MSLEKERVDIKREYELLSTTSKEVWDELMEDFEEIAKSMNLSNKQKDAFMQKYMSELVYNDLAYTNEYLSRTNEMFSQRKIKKNKLEMQRMSRVYKDYSPEVKDIAQQVAEELNKKQQERNNNQKR